MKLNGNLRTKLLALIARMHRNENGAEAGLERILLIAFIALPLLGMLLYYKREVTHFLKDAWGIVTGLH